MRVSILLQLTVLLGSGLKGTYGVPAPWGGWDGGKKMTAGVSDPTGVTLTDVVPTTSTQPEVTASQPEVITSDTPAPEVSSLGTTGGPTGGKGGGESHSVNVSARLNICLVSSTGQIVPSSHRGQPADVTDDPP